jgi:hypothetical protein
MRLHAFAHKGEESQQRIRKLSAYRMAVVRGHVGRFHDDGLSMLGAEGDEMTDDDPNEAYEVVPIEPGPHGPPKGWWTVKRNGLPVRHFRGKEKAQRHATDPEYRASLIARKVWEKAKGK